ncbi:copper resistance protein CopC [Actinotalea sp. M2MS4P-6]|uniref:copper resistance CopC family protein n=1 Tax=Actinotalea sp. M2MS4P-6 TaxID=2983762 RepID=UPI0021E47365|nr:copper resistance CopC family protein [Actinotalea sp. M2MS4P-6]MCV2396295.1 copper resistance protein CopC [Actinotalea sp. M2MS4P-6]
MLHVRRALACLRPALATLTVATALVVAGAQGASAHDVLVATDPQDGAVLDSAPDQVSLTFSADLLDISATILVSGPEGSVPTTVTVDGPVASAELPEGLGSGDYTVTWRVVSSDGHPVQGSFGFSVTGPATSPSGTPSDTASGATTESAPPATTDTPSASAQPAASATPSSTPATSSDASSGTTDVPWLPIGAAVLGAALVGLLAAWAFRRRSS